MTRVEAYRILGILWGNTHSEEEQEALSMAQNDIEFVDLMPDDMVPVVRCKDCAWFADNNNGEWYGCWLFNAIRAGDNKPTLNDYCSYGERKGNE